MGWGRFLAAVLALLLNLGVPVSSPASSPATAPAKPGSGEALRVLRGKYEIGKARIDSMALVAYTNGLASLMQRYKLEGALDTYLLLQKEKADTVALPVLPSGEVRDHLVKNVPGYGAMLGQIENDRRDQLTKLQGQYVGKLDALVKDLMAADKIEEARQAKDEKDAIAQLAQKSVPEKAVAPAPAPAAPDEGREASPAPDQPPAPKPPEESKPAATSPAATPKPAKELLIIKAQVLGPPSPVDITALLQDHVAEGKLEVRDFSIIPRELNSRYYYRDDFRFIMIQYRYRGGLIKTLKRRFGEPILISE